MSTSGWQSGLVLELAEEFLDRYRKGQRPPLREYIERHPELAGEIREVFPAMAMMENIALADESLEGDATGDLPVHSPPILEQLGDYRIVREVGRGGMGVVYEAEQVSLGRHVALKVLPPQMLKDAKTRRRFEREARAAAKLHHTNIVPVFGVGEQGETPYYVMQFIQGQGLDAVLEELKRLRAGQGMPAAAEISTAGRDATAADVARSLLTGCLDMQAETAADGPEPLSTGSDSGHAASLSSSSLTLPGDPARGKERRRTYWQGVAGIGVQVADALAYAHAQGIVHRDIKPSNLLLDNHGIVWVTDFGLAKTDDQQNLTHTGDILGTLRYMPPEAFGGKVDSQGDVYALGLTLYEMLAFRPAFDEQERGRLVKQVTGEAPLPLRRLNSEVPRDLETIVQKAIEREPSHRYASASELAEDLRRFVDDEPIRARRASVAERLARWGRRNPAIAALAAAVALLTIAVMGGLWYGKESARRALGVQTALRAEADERARQAAAAEARADAQAGEARRAAAETSAANRALTAAQASMRRTLYAAQLNLAQAAWDSGNSARTLELLETTRPEPGAVDFRGFEWHYYRRLAHGELAVRKLAGYHSLTHEESESNRSPVLSRDGELAARLLEPEGRNTPPVLVIHETATGGVRRQIPLSALTADYSGMAFHFALAFSGDGTRLALVCRKGRVGPGTLGAEVNPAGVHAFVWSVADGRELLHDSSSTRADTPSGSVDVALSRDGSRLALLTNEYDRTRAWLGDLRVLDFADGREWIHLTSPPDRYWNPTLSPDGRYVAASVFSYTEGASTGSSVRLVLLEVESGRIRTGFGDGTIAGGPCFFSPDGRFLVVSTRRSGDSASDLIVYDLETGRRVATEPLPSSIGSVGSHGFSPDGRLLILASSSGPVCEVREMPSGRLLRGVSLGVTTLTDLAVRPSDGHLITADSAGNIREWPPLSAQPAALDSGHVLEGSGRVVALAADGRELIGLNAPARPDQPARFAVYDVATGQLLRRFERRGAGTLSNRNYLRSRRAVDSLGSRFVFPVLTGEPDDTDHYEVWDSATGQPVASLDAVVLGGGLLDVGRPTPYVALDARGTRLAMIVRVAAPGPGATSTAVSIVELPSGRLLRQIPIAVSTYCVALSPDGRVLAADTAEVLSTGDRRTSIELHDTDSGQLVQTLHGSLRGVDRLAFSPDGLQLAAASYGRVFGFQPRANSSPIEIWHLAAGASPDPVHLDGHGTPVDDLAFSADGRRLATVATGKPFIDGELKLWDTASGRALVTWALPGMPVRLAFDGGHRVRVLLDSTTAEDARVVVFDGSPISPEVEAIDVVDRLGTDALLNSELAERIQAEPGLDPAVRAAGLALVPLRQERSSMLVLQARYLLDGRPELKSRALDYAERAFALAPDMDSINQGTLGEVRYRNGKFAECLEPLRRSLALQDEENLPVERRQYRALAFIAMAEAKLGRRDRARAALDEYRKRRAQESAGSKTPLDDKILADAEAVFREAFGAASKR
jgi:serine/threonine protein kinase/WD40 repeat protein